MQLGLAEADHLGSVVFQEIIDDPLLGLLIQPSDIERDEFELRPVRFHFREISFYPGSVLIGECITSVFSVVCSTPIISLIFVLGLLFPRCYFLLRILGGSSPTITMGFLLGLLFLLPQFLDFCLFFLLFCLTGCSWYLKGSCFQSPLLLLGCP